MTIFTRQLGGASILSAFGLPFVLCCVLIVGSMSVYAAKHLYYGHQGGCDHMDYRNSVPPNSLKCLEVAAKLQHEKKFWGLEFDLWETKHAGLLVYHGGKAWRSRRGLVFSRDGANGAAIPHEEDPRNKDLYTSFRYQNDNLPKWKKVTVADLSVEQLKQFFLWGKYNQHPPDLRTYLRAIEILRIEAPVLIEIKSIRTEQAVENLFSLLETFKRSWEEQIKPRCTGTGLECDKVALWASKEKRYAAPKSIWCRHSKESGIPIYLEH